MLYASQLLGYEPQTLAFSFCILLETMKRGKWFRCSQPWLFGIFESQKHTVCWTASRQVKVFVSRIFGIVVRNAHKLVIAFLFVSNHSTWSIRFSAALAREQALVTATSVLRAIRTILEIFVANLKIALGVNPFVSNGDPKWNVPSLLKRGLNMHFPPKIPQILPPCDNCDIKNGRKQVKKSGQPWLTVIFGMYIKLLRGLACVSGTFRPKNFLSHSLSFFFNVPRWRIG